MLTLGILHTTIRADEKLLLEAAKKHNITTHIIDVRKEIFNPDTYQIQFPLALERCVSTIKGMYATRFLESSGVTVINTSAVAGICEDKFLTSLSLQKAQIATAPFALVFGLEEAKQAIEQLGGFPVVIKPNSGSWGRLLAKINDVDALEAVFDHKDVLGSPHHKAIYLQKYIEKPGRDIRVFSIGGNAICAIYRNADHWITNTAKGGRASNCPVTNELQEMTKKTSDAIGGGILAIDLFETADGFSINEVNHTMEFKNSEEPTGVNISGEIIAYCMEEYKKL